MPGVLRWADLQDERSDGDGDDRIAHAVGRDHRPWYDRQRPDPVALALRAAKSALDPSWILNPGVLVDPPADLGRPRNAWLEGKPRSAAARSARLRVTGGAARCLTVQAKTGRLLHHPRLGSMQKLGVDNQADAVRVARENGWL